MSLAQASYQNRYLLGGAGAAFGVAEWALFAAAGQSATTVSWVVAWVFTSVFGVAALTLLPRVQYGRALLAAAVLALAAGLLSWQGMAGFYSFEQFARAPQMGVGIFLLVTIAIPFLAAGLARPGGWRDYKSLFDQSWDIAFSWAATAVFCGLAWGVLFASGALLGFVGISILSQLLTTPPIFALITGLLIGLGLAVTSERGEFAVPVLILRLLRLLTPVLLVVMVIFLIALPWRGSVGLSLAALCVGAVFVAATLVSAVVADDDGNASFSALLRGSARLLAGVMPLFAGVAALALWLRIDQHGLTPERVCGFTAIVIAAGYGASYLWAAVHRTQWMTRIRRANIVMALAMVALSVLWMARILSPEALAASSQLSRFQAGRVTVEQLPLHAMSSSWGLPGLNAYREIVGEGGAAPTMENDSTSDQDLTEAQARAILAEKMPSMPADHALLAGFAEAYPGWDIEYIARACRLKTPAGYPGCLVAFADLYPGLPGDEAVVFAMDGIHEVSTYARDAAGDWSRIESISWALESGQVGLAIDEMRSKGLRIEPAPFNVLGIGKGYIGVLPRQ